MTRIRSQLQRLYLPPEAGDHDRLVDAHGRTRAVVLSLARPADWDTLATVWRGVQTDLELPAPAIAVSGLDAFQLWFSLAEPVTTAEAQSFLDALCRRYLPHVANKRLKAFPSLEGVHAPLVPTEQADSGNWSAFVAPDLAPVFTDTPWLDIPPSPDGQADLLTALQCISPSGWSDAVARLQAVAPDKQPTADVSPPGTTAGTPLTSACNDAREFLLRVMNDDTLPMTLRIDAAKALLPFTPGR